ncbi:hypothetical protein, partial [Planococcus koreensis]
MRPRRKNIGRSLRGQCFCDEASAAMQEQLFSGDEEAQRFVRGNILTLVAQTMAMVCATIFLGSTLNVGVFTQFIPKKDTQSPTSFILEMSSN